MTWTKVARKDFEDVARSKMLWGLIAVFVGFMGFVVLVALGASDTSEATGDAALRVTAQIGQLFVPLIALIAGYLAIVGERRSGSLRILLSFPPTRRDVVMGKLVGRTAVIGAALAIGSAASVLLVALAIESPDLGDVAGLLASIVLFGAAITGLAVGISAAVGTRGKAMALAIGSVLAFLLVWDAAAAGVYLAVTGSLPGLEVEAWYFLLKRLSPVGAFRALAAGFVQGDIQPFFRFGLEEIPPNTPPERLTLSNRVSGSPPFYLTEWFAAATLACWGVVAAGAGYLRFRNADL
ncbi:NosY protein [Halobacteriales archaeon QS_1_67_19]|nr:MAG: NosY protein [Halobacteriales archaeon QS_1_67_19]